MVNGKGETISPGSFLPLAEKYGLIGEIDKWVVRQAIHLAAGGRRFETNLSAESISDPDLLSLIDRELRDEHADPGKVVFDITETALLRNLRSGEAFARGLAEMGCGLALDDFGTPLGFDGFRNLATLPISYLKIHVDFVCNLFSNPANRHVVKATVELARHFGYDTIAEGVEDAETLEQLKDDGVDFAQGFHLGRPAPLETS